MRQFHRWLSVIFGGFLLFIAATGVMSQFASIVADGEPKVEAPAGFVCLKTMTCRPRPDPDGAGPWVSWLHHIHSGEEFGPGGVAVSIMSGLALLFFAFSGLWMYLKMWAHRKARGLGGTFWK